MENYEEEMKKFRKEKEIENHKTIILLIEAYKEDAEETLEEYKKNLEKNSKISKEKKEKLQILNETRNSYLKRNNLTNIELEKAKDIVAEIIDTQDIIEKSEKEINELNKKIKELENKIEPMKINIRERKEELKKILSN